MSLGNADCPASVAIVGTVPISGAAPIPSITSWTQDSIAALAAGGVYTGGARQSQQATNRLTAQAYSDQPGTLYVDWQINGAWVEVKNQPLQAGTVGYSGQIDFRMIVSFYYRLRYVNGGTAQTFFGLGSETGV